MFWSLTSNDNSLMKQVIRSLIGQFCALLFCEIWSPSTEPLDPISSFHTSRGHHTLCASTLNSVLVYKGQSVTARCAHLIYKPQNFSQHLSTTTMLQIVLLMCTLTMSWISLSCITIHTHPCSVLNSSALQCGRHGETGRNLKALLQSVDVVHVWTVWIVLLAKIMEWE